MKAQVLFINEISGNFLFEVNGHRLKFWNSSDSIISLEDYSNRVRLGFKAFESNKESVEQYIKKNIDLCVLVAERGKLANDIHEAIRIKRKFAYRIDDDILIVTLEVKNYFAITADRVGIESEESILSRKEDYIQNYSECCEVDIDEAEDMVESNLNAYGIEAIEDISLYPYSNTINDTEYYYPSSSCGCLHDDILRVAPEFKKFIDLHLNENIHELVNLYYELKNMPEQDIDNTIKQLTEDILQPF